MKENCIVCAKEFDNPNMERLTCSDECKTKWIEFLGELRTVPEDERKKKIAKFFSGLYLKCWFPL